MHKNSVKNWHDKKLASLTQVCADTNNLDQSAAIPPHPPPGPLTGLDVYLLNESSLASDPKRGGGGAANNEMALKAGATTSCIEDICCRSVVGFSVPGV